MRDTAREFRSVTERQSRPNQSVPQSGKSSFPVLCSMQGLTMSTAQPMIKSRQAEKEINGIRTQVVCTEFNNYILVVLTQYGKMGSLVSITADSTSSDVSTPMFSTKVLMGKDEPLTHVCAKNLATRVSQEAGNRPVLLGLALKDTSIEAVKLMRDLITSCQVW
ncbi:hypothetical protein NHX12_031810 [Muraenolepis orangiensis]|uniref:Proteasome assembly chaperone 3 n=1 Tax=Muraenolepis orangiensis TaxID=630683 RepID=A0A9Q0IK14_9TELE|nr:hypothetical protein NHX12_031810 [Muraenolepis orangiensis]